MLDQEIWGYTQLPIAPMLLALACKLACLNSPKACVRRHANIDIDRYSQTSWPTPSRCVMWSIVYPLLEFDFCHGIIGMWQIDRWLKHYADEWFVIFNWLVVTELTPIPIEGVKGIPLQVSHSTPRGHKQSCLAMPVGGSCWTSVSVFVTYTDHPAPEGGQGTFCWAHSHCVCTHTHASYLYTHPIHIYTPCAMPSARYILYPCCWLPRCLEWQYDSLLMQQCSAVSSHMAPWTHWIQHGNIITCCPTSFCEQGHSACLSESAL